MLRFSSIIYSSVLLLGALPAAQSQQTVPLVPARRPPRPAPAPSVVPGTPGVLVPSRRALAVQPAPVNPSPTPSPQPQVAAAPPVPVSQPPAEQPHRPTTPPVAPVVIFRDGQLTVQAVNSSLSAVISAIRSKTGIEFEGSEGSSERVAISMGPAPEGDVLAAIFAGSRFDYIAIGRTDSPGIVQRVILTPRSIPGGPADAQVQPARPAGNADSDEDDAPDEGGNEPQDTAVQPPPQQQQPPPAQNQPKSPDQLLQELREMQRQQQQQQPPQDPGANHPPKTMPPL